MKKIYFILCVLPVFAFSQTQIGVDIDGEASNDSFGRSISLSADGNTLAVGSSTNDGNGTNSGSVRIYTNNGGNWLKIGQDIDGEAANDLSGSSVSLSSNGSIVAIGAPGNDGNGSNSGHVRVYELTISGWIQQGQDIDGESADDGSGISVSLSSFGNMVAIGGYLNDGNGSNSGHVRVYEYNGSTWQQLGQDIDGEATGDQSGISVSLSALGDYLAIGGYQNAGNGSSSGHTRIYQFNSGTWTQLGQDIDGENLADFSGNSVSIADNGLTVAIGAQNNDGNGSDSGHVRIYNYNGTAWIQKGQDINGEFPFDAFGVSVAISGDGNILAVGANRNDGNGTDSGHMRLYQFSSGSWIQIGSDINGEAADDRFGGAVGISDDGTIVAGGAFQNDGNGNNAGHVRVYDISSSLSTTAFTLKQISLYPNPVQDVLKIDSKETINQVTIQDVLGKTVVQIKNPNSEINLSELKSGVYFLTLEASNSKNQTKKFVKQ